MKTIYDLKPAFQSLLRPMSNGLAACGVTPNQITISALILSLVGGLLIATFPTEQWPLLIVPIILFIRMILNAIDGMIAREHHQQSAFGTFLNEIGDVLSDAFLYLPFVYIANINISLVLVVTILAIISEMTGCVAVQIGASRRYDGPMGKSDRAFVFGLIALLLGINRVYMYIANILLVVMTALLVVTIINRVYKALQEGQHGTRF